MSRKCPDCGNDYSVLGIHLSRSECEYTSITDYQKQVITGLLMGDGCIMKGDKNHALSVRVIKREYLEYIDNLFPFYGMGVSLEREAKNDNYNDLYAWRTMRCPEISEFRSWYSSGKKIFPEEIDLTPGVLKHWYVCDGSYCNNNTSNHIQISSENEKDNKDKIEKYFADSVGVEINSWYGHNFKFTVDDSHELFEYMGSPLPGFEYKWPQSYR